MGRRALPPKHLKEVRLDVAAEGYIDGWRRAAQRTGSSTPLGYAGIMRTVVRTLGAATPVWTLTSGDLRRAFEAVVAGADEQEAAERKRAGQRARRGRTTAGSISQVRTVIRSFAEFCVDERWLDDGVTLHKNRFNTREAKNVENAGPNFKTRIPESKWPVILAMAERVHPRCRIAVALGAYGGRRVSEIVRMQWNDIDFEQKLVHFYNLKRRRSGSIPLYPQLCEEIELWRRVVTELYGVPQPEWYLVPNRVLPERLHHLEALRNGMTNMAAVRREPWRWPLDMTVPSRIETVQHDVRKLCDELKLPPGANTHTFRRSAAKVVAKKYGLPAAQALLDHESIVTTQIYTGNEDGQELLWDALMSGEAFPSSVNLPDNVVELRPRYSAAE